MLSPIMPASNLISTYSGVIMVAAGLVDYRHLMEGLTADIPKILINRPAKSSEISSISVDNRIGMYRAVKVLLELGHRRIAIDSSGDPSLPGLQRTQGYLDAFADRDIQVDKSLFMEYRPGEPRWVEDIRKLLQREDRPTALIVDNSGKIPHLLDILDFEGLKIPDDISLIVFDDSPELTHFPVRISVIDQPLKKMGIEAVQMIRKMIDGQLDGIKQQVLPSEFIVRDSISVATKRTKKSNGFI
jgi:LacI family transcriptional regulator